MDYWTWNPLEMKWKVYDISGLSVSDSQPADTSGSRPHAAISLIKSQHLVTCLLLFYVLATFKVITGWEPTCDNMHSSRLYSAVPLWDQQIITMTWYPIQSHYSDTEPTSLCPILLKLSARLGSEKYQCHNSLVLLSWDLSLAKLCSTAL